MADAQAREVQALNEVFGGIKKNTEGLSKALEIALALEKATAKFCKNNANLGSKKEVKIEQDQTQAHTKTLGS